MVTLTCANCGRKVDAKEPPKKFCCSICGAINNVVSENSGTGLEACGCLLPTSFEFKMPAGKIGNKITGYKYITADDGMQLTKEEWIRDFGCDPDIVLEYMRSGAAANERDDDIDIGGRKAKPSAKPVKLGR